MKHLWIKMFRDVRSNWAQFVCVFLMSLGSMMVFSGMSSIWTGISHTVNNYAQETNLADSWLYGSNISLDEIEKINNLEGVESSTFSMENSFDLEDSTGNLRIISLNNTNAIKPKVINGPSFDLKNEGIWIDDKFAEANKLTVGDQLKFKINHQTKTLKVLGTVLSAEFIYYTGSITESIPHPQKYGYAFVNETSMKDLAGGLIYTTGRLKINKNIGDQQIKDILKEKYIGEQAREDKISYMTVKKENSQMQKMATLFSALFVLLSLLTMYTSMARLVNAQRVQIGTMQALGIKNIWIRLHYASYAFFVPLLGGITGVILGRLFISPSLIEIKKSTLALPIWELRYSTFSLILLLGIILICVIASLLATQRELKQVPAEAMRGAPPKGDEKTILDRIFFIWKNISAYNSWVLRDILRHKIRFIMGVVGVAGGLILIVAGFGISESIKYSNDYVFQTQFKYDIKAVLKNPGEIVKIEQNHQWIEEQSAEIFSLDQQTIKDGLVTICDEGQMLYFATLNDEEIKLPNDGAIISAKIANDLSVKKDDTVKIKLFGKTKSIELKIKEISKNLMPQGIFISKLAYQNSNQRFIPTTLLAKDMSKQDLEDKAIFKSIITKEQQIDNTNTLLKSINSIIQLLITASIILSMVILYNLGMLSFVERTREYATMKVLGFYQSEIRSIALRDCICSTILGFIIGAPLSIGFLNLYIKIVSFENFQWISHISYQSFILSIIIIASTSILVTLVLSYKIKKIDMVGALKSIE